MSLPLCRIAGGLAALLVLTATRAAPVELAWPQLLAGEILVESARTEDGLDGVRVVFAVAAPRARIWQVLTDYKHFQEIFPRIERMVVLDQDATGATVEFWGDAVVTDLHYVLRRAYVEPGRRLTWRRLSGDLERIEGSWQIVDGGEPNLHVLIYESFVDVGVTIVTWMIRQGAMHEARNMATRLRVWIERAP